LLDGYEKYSVQCKWKADKGLGCRRRSRLSKIFFDSRLLTYRLIVVEGWMMIDGC
jgi:hypothetical protein